MTEKEYLESRISYLEKEIINSDDNPDLKSNHQQALLNYKQWLKEISK